MASWRHYAMSNSDVSYCGYGLLPDDHFAVLDSNSVSISPPLLQQQPDVNNIQQPPVDERQRPVADQQAPDVIATPRKRKARVPHSDYAVAVLSNWYEANRHHPFANRQTVAETRLTETQVRNWLANRRKKFGECLRRWTNNQSTELRLLFWISSEYASFCIFCFWINVFRSFIYRSFSCRVLACLILMSVIAILVFAGVCHSPQSCFCTVRG